MAIADAEPKKGDIDVTSTGSSSSSNEMKKPLGPIKYSSLKHFTIAVSDIWDDRNICIFIECCHAHIEDLKNYNGSKENKVWEKITKAGLEKAGSVNCFNVNYCLELAKSLKHFVYKNENTMMDNAIFKLLYENVVDLLPYFGSGSPSRPRSRSKSVENVKSDKVEVESHLNHLICKPFDTYSETHVAIRILARILKKYNIDDLKKTSSRTAIWKEIATHMDADMGLGVSPKAFIHSYKTSVAGYVRRIVDPVERDEIFRSQVDDLMPYFDLIPPRSIKSSDFLLPDVTSSNDGVSTRLDVKKRKLDMSECLPESSPKAKRQQSDNENSSLEPSMELKPVHTDPPVLRTYLKKKVNVDKDDSHKTLKSSKSSNDSANEFNDSIDPQLERKTPGSEVPPEHSSTVEIDESTTPLVKVAKKRGRKPKNASAPKLLPSRRSTRNQRNESELTSSTETPLQMSRELVPVRHSANSMRRADLSPEFRGVPPKNEMYGMVNRSMYDSRDSDDSEIEDVPLMGTNITVHTLRGKVEQSKCQSSKGNMNPIVLLDKISTENYFHPSTSRGVKLASQPPKRLNEVRNSVLETKSRPKAEAPKSEETVIVRRKPGRPRANQAAKPVKNVPSYGLISTRGRENSAEVTSSSALMRNPPQAVENAYLARKLATQETNSSLHNMVPIPPSPNANVTAVFRTHSDMQSESPPEWFERFVVENRKHEVWKLHNLIKMQNELMDTECRKTALMEKILDVLSSRPFDRS